MPARLQVGHAVAAASRLSAPRAFQGSCRFISGTGRLCKADEDEILESVGKVQPAIEKGQNIPKYPSNVEAQTDQDNEDEIFASVGALSLHRRTPDCVALLRTIC
jgi:hypothetical protein